MTVDGFKFVEFHEVSIYLKILHLDSIKNGKTLSGYFRISTFNSRNLLPWQPIYDFFLHFPQFSDLPRNGTKDICG